VTDTWYTGNASDDAADYRGWLIGNFVPNGPRHSEAVEIKWGIHPAGQAREQWATDEQRTTAVLLVRGRFRVELSTGPALLEKVGDYVLWGPGIDHTWAAQEDSIVITVRWPSIQSEVRATPTA
jgi:quercetin dioxygenase-like cupin family protein